MNLEHTSVLVEEAISALSIYPGGIYIDATLGGGGHAERINALGGRVVGLDQDPVAIKAARDRLDPKLTTVIQGNFLRLYDLVTEAGYQEVDGVLYDLGTSAFQLDDPERGFSFQGSAPLDMRMSPDLGVTAADLVNALSKKELIFLFSQFAQERRAPLIAQKIIDTRKDGPIRTTGVLANLVFQVYGGKKGKLHPATKVFQALRIAVNDELNSLKASLPQAVGLLKTGGRLVVISFHEGEDRIAKRFIKKAQAEGILENLTKKPLVPGEAEVALNPRSRSAKMRIAEKL